MTSDSGDYRLPTDVRPTHYDVTVRTDLEKLSFDGYVKIDLEVRKETSAIVLNSAELSLGDASIYSEALKTEQIQSSASVDTATQRITIHFLRALPAGSKAQMRIGFKGILTGSMTGYYRSAWMHEGKTKYYALTQFEPTDARRAFPCWDEPLLKATFAITLISRADTVNLSNMPVISEEIYEPGFKQDTTNAVPALAQLFASLTTVDQGADKWKISKFSTTPPMSTYIVAFANGPFEYLESSYKSPLSGRTRPLRIYATSDNIHQTQFALDVKAKVLPLYEKVFDVEYPLPKLDTLVASDFDAGAMENWGLITGRVQAYLIDPEKADLTAKQRVAGTQSHEVAHMWFGNITTMSWWDNLYLNEGFATLMGEVIIPNKVFPEWKMEPTFINEHLASALNLDAKLSSHPIEVDCPDANQINQIFDALSYSKAASVLRMLSNYVGEDRFLKGVSVYLKKRLYGNSVTRDLWDGIAEVTGVDVPRMMDNWVSKIGFPLVTVTETKDGIRVRQDRFLETGPAEPKDNETIWTIPLCLLSADENGQAVVDQTPVLDEREKTITLDTTKPFKLNAKTTGVYRVLYSPERLAKIGTEAARENSLFSLDDRIGLVQDAMALSKAGFAKMSSALTLMQILKGEKEFLVWDSIAANLSVLRSIWFENPRITSTLNEFTRELFLPLVRRLGYEYSEADSPDTILLRTCCIEQTAAVGDEGVVQELMCRFKQYLKTGEDSRIPPDLLRITYKTAVRYGSREEYEAMKRILQQRKTPTAATAAMIAMGATEDLQLAQETLQYTLTKTRDQDVIYFFGGLSANHKTRRLLAQFFKDHYDTLYKRFEGNYTMNNLVKMSFAGFSTQKDYEETSRFFEGKDTSKYRLPLLQSLDTIRSRSAIIERSSTHILEWSENRKTREGRL